MSDDHRPIALMTSGVAPAASSAEAPPTLIVHAQLESTD